MQKSQRGLTLIELLVALAIAAILATLAAPSFKRLVLSNSMSSAVNTFLSDARFARSEAIRLGGKVTMCRSDDPEAASPACAAATGLGTGGKGWAGGWIIFHDKDSDGSIDAGEVIRVQAALTSVDVIQQRTGTTLNTSNTKFVFTATGRLTSSTLSTDLIFGSSSKFGSSLQRVVCLAGGGRTRVITDVTTSCGGE